MLAQQLFDTISRAARDTRADYHVTLGELIRELDAVPPDLPVLLDDGMSPGPPHSYRGHYADLAFEPTKSSVTAGDLLEWSRRALGGTFTGWKGGDFTMDTRTPLWVASEGDLGRALVGIRVTTAGLRFDTREVG